MTSSRDGDAVRSTQCSQWECEHCQFHLKAHISKRFPPPASADCMHAYIPTHFVSGSISKCNQFQLQQGFPLNLHKPFANKLETNLPLQLMVV